MEHGLFPFTSINDYIDSVKNILYGQLIPFNEIMMTESSKGLFSKKYKHWYDISRVMDDGNNHQTRIPYNLSNEMVSDFPKLLISLVKHVGNHELEKTLLMRKIPNLYNAFRGEFEDVSNNIFIKALYISTLLCLPFQDMDYYYLLTILKCETLAYANDIENTATYWDDTVNLICNMIKFNDQLCKEKENREKSKKDNDNAIKKFIVQYCRNIKNINSVVDELIRSYGTFENLLNHNIKFDKSNNLSYFDVRDINDGIKKYWTAHNYKKDIQSMVNLNNAYELKKQLASDALIDKKDVAPHVHDEPTYICTICDDRKINVLIIPCRHTFCKKCINIWINESNKITCPLCRSLMENQIEMII